jgi:wax ester synthase-like acyl-CoA acyltransferase family protein
MFDPSVAALFPLPLTTFEKYMLWDDRPEYPMVFALQLKLCGELRRAVFESSVTEALSRHPLLCALVKRSAQSGPVWMLAEGLGPVVDWDVLGVAIDNPRGERIDLSSEVGLRIWVRQGDGAAEVTLQFHHACCDGIGALRFIGHVLAAYGMRTASADCRPTLHPSDPAGLLKRGQFASQPPARGSRARTVWAGVRDGLRWVSRRPVILCPREATSPVAAASLPFLESYRYTFDASETERIRQAATRQGATVNDLLLRDMFQTLHQWNAERGSGSAEHWLRIAVPVNLKTGDNDRMSAANGVSYTFLTRLGSQCTDSHELLRNIRGETDVITRRRRALLFLRGFQLMTRIPGAIPMYMRENRCFATVVLSNFGDLSRHFGAQFPCESGKVVAGNVILEEVFGAPPVRANTRAAFLIGTYGERLWVCVRCDPRVFPADDADRLLSSYVDRIKRTMAEVTGDEKGT